LGNFRSAVPVRIQQDEYAAVVARFGCGKIKSPAALFRSVQKPVTSNADRVLHLYVVATE